MRRIAKVDANQKEIVVALRKMGATVQHLHTLGKGCPDILVGFRGRNYLFEIKDGGKVPSKRKLTPDEEEWIRAWNGHVSIIEKFQDAFEVLTCL